MSLAKVQVTFLSYPALGGFPTSDMEKAIRRSIVLNDLVNQARYVEVTCGWHLGGRKDDPSVDPLNHCTFKVFDTRMKHIKTLHGHPESEVPASQAELNDDWKVNSGVPGQSRLINQKLNIAKGTSGPRGSPRQSGILRESKFARENRVPQQSRLRDSSSSQPRFGKPPIQDKLIASVAQLSLQQGKVSEELMSSPGAYIPPQRRSLNNGLSTVPRVPRHLRNANNNIPVVPEAPEDEDAASSKGVPPLPQQPVTRGANRLVPETRDKDTGRDLRTSTNTYELFNREPLAKKSANTKMTSGQAEPKPSQQEENKKPGPNDWEKNRKGKLGRK